MVECIDYELGNGAFLRYYKICTPKKRFENRWLLLDSNDKLGEDVNLLSDRVVDILLMFAKNVNEKRIDMENKKALVVDDSTTILSYHENLLRAFSFDVETASNGMEALERSLQKNYDLILSDVNMPVMDGFEFIKKFRKDNKKTPVVFITTLDSDSDKARGLLNGANLYIVKPIDLVILKEILESLAQ